MDSFGDRQRRRVWSGTRIEERDTEQVKHVEYRRTPELGAEDERANAFSAFVGFDGSMKT